jgi:hypothetical protein
LHLYLNDSDNQPTDKPLKGGATTFWDSYLEDRLDVQPKMGSILIFQQRNLMHAGDDVVSGTKITMRTELMYEKAEELAPEPDSPKKSVESVPRKTIGWVKSRRGAK